MQTCKTCRWWFKRLRRWAGMFIHPEFADELSAADVAGYRRGMGDLQSHVHEARICLSKLEWFMRATQEASDSLLQVMACESHRPMTIAVPPRPIMFYEISDAPTAVDYEKLAVDFQRWACEVSLGVVYNRNHPYADEISETTKRLFVARTMIDMAKSVNIHHTHKENGDER